MSFPPAISHLENALTHAKAGNASKAMHHVGHALNHLRGMTTNAGGSPKAPLAMPPAKSKSAIPNEENGATQPAAGSLRARLASQKAGVPQGDGDADDASYGSGGY